MTNALHVESMDQFNQTVANGVTLVDFFADRCGPCKMLSPILENIAEEQTGRATVAKVDIDAHNDIAGEYGIMSIPTVYIFVNGQQYGEPVVGAHPKETYTALLDAAVVAAGATAAPNAGQPSPDASMPPQAA